MNTPPKHLAAAIELLDYPDTEGIHHSEKHWREVARWLLGQLRNAEERLVRQRPRDYGEGPIVRPLHEL